MATNCRPEQSCPLLDMPFQKWALFWISSPAAATPHGTNSDRERAAKAITAMPHGLARSTCGRAAAATAGPPWVELPSELVGGGGRVAAAAAARAVGLLRLDRRNEGNDAGDDTDGDQRPGEGLRRG